MIPHFWRDMPPAKPGLWRVTVHRFSAFGPRREVRHRVVRGLRRAYVVARLLALLEDLVCPYYDGNVGVEWQVQRYAPDAAP